MNHDMGQMDHSKMGHDMAGMDHGAMMKHDDPNSVLVEPGKTAELTWTFSAATGLEFAATSPATTRRGWSAARSRHEAHAIGAGLLALAADALVAVTTW